MSRLFDKKVMKNGEYEKSNIIEENPRKSQNNLCYGISR